MEGGARGRTGKGGGNGVGRSNLGKARCQKKRLQGERNFMKRKNNGGKDKMKEKQSILLFGGGRTMRKRKARQRETVEKKESEKVELRRRGGGGGGGRYGQGGTQNYSSVLKSNWGDWSNRTGKRGGKAKRGHPLRKESPWASGVSATAPAKRKYARTGRRDKKRRGRKPYAMRRGKKPESNTIELTQFQIQDISGIKKNGGCRGTKE